MIVSSLLASLRHLTRNKLYATINILGLAVGFAAALLIALFVRDELAFDRFWPDYRRIHIVSMTIESPGAAPLVFDAAPSDVARRLNTKLPADVQIAGLADGAGSLRRGGVEYNEKPQWADGNFFEVLRPSVVAGKLDSAWQRPDAVVLTESAARKYFGRASAVGQTLELDRIHPLRVAAVIADLPANTHLTGEIFISALATFSPLYAADAAQHTLGNAPIDTAIYLKLPGSVPPATVERELHAIAQSYMPTDTMRASFSARPIADLHFSPPALAAERPRGSLRFLLALSIVGVLIVTVAAINFVTLMTVSAVRRAAEIGVRKAVGASRSDLVRQFLGESLLHAGIAIVIAFALAELMLPKLSAFLDRAMSLHYLADLPFIACAILAALMSAVVVGIYPALVLAGLRPVTALKGDREPALGAGRVRQWPVVAQFTILIGLIALTLVVHRQVDFALNQGLRLDKDRVVAIVTPCHQALVAEIRKLPGVRGTACSASAPLEIQISASLVVASNGTRGTIRDSAVGPGLFELYGLQPLAGRFFSVDDGRPQTDATAVVANQTAVRRFKLGSAQAALGQNFRGNPNQPELHIIGVVPDFPVTSIRKPIEPTLYYANSAGYGLLSVKLNRGTLAPTLEAIDRLWALTGEPRPIKRMFVDQYVRDQYVDENRQRVLSALFSLVAICIACLGLFGLSAYTAQKRTKEIGIRKAIGAGRMQIVRLLLWDFSKPVLLANLIAWPAAYWLAQRWLQGFAYHIDPQLWMFASAGALALAVAGFTVLVHSLRVAQSKPVEALRCE